ncbi:MAG: carboxyl-terminal processing protease CtpB [Microcystaceae cyanobacterium]
MTHYLRLSFARLIVPALLTTLGLGTAVLPSHGSTAPQLERSPSATVKPKAKVNAITPLVLEDSPAAVVDEVWQIVNNEFVDKSFNRTDWRAKRLELLGQRYSNRQQAYKAINQALKGVGDPYTRFLDPGNFADLTSQTSGEISGVGLRLTLDKRTNDLMVLGLVKNSPAMKAGLKSGDRLVRINGKPTALMNLEQASQEIQGEIGTEVNLQLAREGKGVFNVSLKRAQIELDSVSYKVKQEGPLSIGYIRLDEFSSHAAEQMKVAIEDLGKKNIKGYVLDLRGNPGGLLFASVDIARMWLKKGEIVSTIDRKGGDRHFSANGTEITNLPLVILVNQGSASASEILTGALKENGRATIVGTTTYGKGTVQSVHSLSDGSGLAVTIARYYPPSGTDINHKGINPDVYLELSLDEQLRLRNDPDLFGTDADPQYIKAISVLQHYGSSFPQPVASPTPVGALPQSKIGKD